MDKQDAFQILVALGKLTKLAEVSGAVREEVETMPAPCGYAVEHRFYDVDGAVIRQDQSIVVTESYLLSAAQGEAT